MMLTWRVFSDEHPAGELLHAERMFINTGNGLLFSIPPPTSESVAPKATAAVVKKTRGPAQMITVRAYNAHAWHRVELVR